MDSDAGVLGEALLAVLAADPGELVGALARQLRRTPNALDLTLHLTDYRLSLLMPARSQAPQSLVRPESVTDSAIDQTLRLQRPTAERVPAGHLQHVPVTVRGQRLGVFTATYRAPPSRSDMRVLHSLALAAAYSLLEAGTGTDVYETPRRHGRLSVAAEMQWQLLPARSFQTRNFCVAGHLEPALRVCGDAFDFVVDDDVLTVAVIDATTSGGAPSFVTALAITALRNARRSGLRLGEQASLASDFIWQHTRGTEHVNALLMQLHARSGAAYVIDAGSPTVLRGRDGELTELQLESQTPLGMFEDTQYAEQVVDLRPGDRAYLLTDGAFLGETTMTRIIELLHSGDPQDREYQPPESLRRLAAALTHDGQEPEDDITIVCVDWTAREHNHKALGLNGW